MTEEILAVYRHSLAHVLAKAVIEIFGKENVQYAIGPQIADGLYYDFVLPRPVTEDDYKVIDDGGRHLFLTHGHVWGPGFHNSIERMPELVEGDALLYGHTHIKVLSQIDGITIFNPGSVGIPKDGSHSYGVYDRGAFEHREL